MEQVDFMFLFAMKHWYLSSFQTNSEFSSGCVTHEDVTGSLLLCILIQPRRKHINSVLQLLLRILWAGEMVQLYSEEACC